MLSLVKNCMQFIEVNYKEYDLFKLFIYIYFNEYVYQNQVENFLLCYIKFSLFNVCCIVNMYVMWSDRIIELFLFLYFIE